MKLIFSFIMMTGLAIYSCSDDKREKNEAPPVEVTDSGDPGQEADLGSSDAGPSGPSKTMQQCNAEGKAWLAVVNSGNSPPTCAGQLASFGCCKAQTVSRFPAVSDKLSESIDKNVNEGLKLYNCEEVSASEYRLHFVGYPGEGRTEYRYLRITGFPADPASDVEDCPQIPDEFVSPSDDSDQEDDEDDDGSGEEEGDDDSEQEEDENGDGEEEQE